MFRLCFMCVFFSCLYIHLSFYVTLSGTTLFRKNPHGFLCYFHRFLYDSVMQERRDYVWCVCVSVCHYTHEKVKRSLVSCTADRLCLRFHSPATSAVNRPSSQFYNYLGRGWGTWPVRESFRECEKEMGRSNEGGQ